MTAPHESQQSSKNRQLAELINAAHKFIQQNGIFYRHPQNRDVISEFIVW